MHNVASRFPSLCLWPLLTTSITLANQYSRCEYVSSHSHEEPDTVFIATRDTETGVSGNELSSRTWHPQAAWARLQESGVKAFPTD